MQGIGFKSIMKNPALIPLYVCIGVAASGALFFSVRSATRNPDVSWRFKADNEPWEAYRNKQFKFYSPTRDYSTSGSKAPLYKDVE